MKQGSISAVELFSFQCSCGLSSFGMWAQLPNSTWHLSSLIESNPRFPVSKGRFSTTKPPGMSPPLICFLYVIFIHLKIFLNFPAISCIIHCWSMQFNLHICGDFPVFFLIFISSFIPLQLEKILNCQSLLGDITYIICLENILCVFEKTLLLFFKIIYFQLKEN